MRKLQAISLFTGAGGLDYGFEAAGVETAVAIEMDADCCRTLVANRTWPVIHRDIAEVPTDEILSVCSGSFCCSAKLSEHEPDRSPTQERHRFAV